MGFLSQVLGKKPEYPPLEANDPAASRIGEMKEPLERLAGDLPDPLEIVPTNEAAYAFIGKPPKKFGVAWVDPDGEIHNFKTLVEDRGLSVVTLEKLSDELKAAYMRCENEARFSTRIGEREVVVTPSESLGNDLTEIIQKFSG